MVHGNTGNHHRRSREVMQQPTDKQKRETNIREGNWKQIWLGTQESGRYPPSFKACCDPSGPLCLSPVAESIFFFRVFS